MSQNLFFGFCHFSLPSLLVLQSDSKLGTALLMSVTKELSFAHMPSASNSQ